MLTKKSLHDLCESDRAFALPATNYYPFLLLLHKQICVRKIRNKIVVGRGSLIREKKTPRIDDIKFYITPFEPVRFYIIIDYVEKSNL